MSAAADAPDREAAGRRAVAELARLVAELPERAREQALTHSSWTARRHHAWGRPAFLGDSVLGLIVADELYRRYPRSDIGRLTKVHGQVVSGRACAEVAEWLGVPEMLRERAAGAPESGTPAEELIAGERSMASITEALIGAVYLEIGLGRLAPTVLAAFEPRITLATETLLDFKSALQEALARHNKTVTYAVVAESGPAHARHFEVEARVDGAVVGSGSGGTKKAAEQAAAAMALEDDR